MVEPSDIIYQVTNLFVQVLQSTMFSTLKIFFAVSVIHVVKCSIDGISYINDRNKIEEEKYKKGDDPCNPLYWYPQMRPAYCDEKQEAPRHKLVPLPIPVPAPPPPPPAPPVPIGIPIVPSNPFIPVAGIPLPMPPPIPPQFYMPPPAFPIPAATCMAAAPCPQQQAMPSPPMPQPAMPPPGFPMPAPAYPMPYPYAPYPMPYPMYFPPQPMIGLVPGINGMVSKDGAINIMPFSDVYADVLEKHRQKVVRKRLENVLNEHNGRRQDNRRTMTQKRAELRRHVARSERNLSE